MKNRTVLLTGGTGIMGSWVLGEALSRGYDPIVLMRDADRERASERLRAVLQHVDRSADLSRLQILLGDARLPNLGLREVEVTRLRETIGAVVHCAACTSFSEEQNEECWSTNLGGVVNLLDFVSGSDVRLHHVSTAYVAGKRCGRVLETELDVTQEFNNTYERSKCESEKLVRRAFDEGRVQGSIFRPSIITGSTRDGRILQFMNFYNVLRVVDLMASRQANGGLTVRMVAAAEGTKNLIPVDWTAKALWQIIENEGPSGRVYHLTNPKPFTHGAIQEWANGLLESNRIRVELVENVGGDVTSLEAIFTSRFKNYRPYMHGEPDFDRTNTDRALNGSLPFPQIDFLYCNMLLDFARAQGWRSLFSPRPRAKEAAEEKVRRFHHRPAGSENAPIWACDAGVGA